MIESKLRPSRTIDSGVSPTKERITQNGVFTPKSLMQTLLTKFLSSDTGPSANRHWMLTDISELSVNRNIKQALNFKRPITAQS